MLSFSPLCITHKPSLCSHLCSVAFAGQVKKELAQLDALREEVARIRRMNEAEMPAIGEKDHHESESDAESVASPVKQRHDSINARIPLR